MGWVRRVHVVWMLLATLLHACNVESCIEEERLALLNLDSYFQIHGDPNPQFPRLGKLKGENDEHNCCFWERVECNATTQRVTELHLSDMVWPYSQQRSWEFNVTMLQPFVQLVRLDLARNSIGGLVEQNELRNLRELRLLDLSGNHFDNSIFQKLANIRQLQGLDLSFNSVFNYSYDSKMQGFSNLTELQILDLSHSNFYGSIQGICKWENILELRLPGNQFTGRVPSCLANCSSLQVLDLSDNYFEGKLSLSLFANFTKLRVLDLSRNQLVVETEDSLWHPLFQLQSLGLQGCNVNKPDGMIPKFLQLQKNLSEIHLSDNCLVGSFPTWLITHNPHLRLLELQNNSFTGYLELPPYICQSLDTLDISANKFQGKLPNNIGLVFPQLQYLNVSQNHFEGSVPNSIASLSQLGFLDLSNNNFSGELPRQLLSNCTHLETLQLNDNNLQGEIVPEHMNLTQLYWLDLSNNSFGGTIKDALLKSSGGLHYLDMSKNKVTGQLPNFIGNFHKLKAISVSSNNLQGQVPIDICRLQLLYLDLSENNFTGPIPPCSNFSSLHYLHLHRNSLTGPIPNALSQCSNLTTLDLRNNKLSGTVPQWIGMLVNLQALLLARNNFHGRIPHVLCQLQDINILDLSYNHLSGDILTCFSNMSFGIRNITKDSYGLNDYFWMITYGYLQEIYSDTDQVQVLVKNQYLSYAGRIRRLMSGLDLSCNNLSGIIPLELGDLTHVQALNLSHNCLTGSIPSTFSNLKAVEGLDLSFNNLHGMIPNQMAGLYSLEIFNVSYNNLTGRTPETGQFGNFDETSYYGNPGLCVALLNKSCGPGIPNALPPSANTAPAEDGDGGVLAMEDFLWSFGMTAFVAFVATTAVLCINRQWRETWFDFVEWHLLWWLL